MGVKVYTRQADNLLDLITLIAEAIGALGVDANWSGYEDGTLNMWSEEDGPILAIEPNMKRLKIIATSKTHYQGVSYEGRTMATVKQAATTT